MQAVIKYILLTNECWIWNKKIVLNPSFVKRNFNFTSWFCYRMVFQSIPTSSDVDINKQKTHRLTRFFFCSLVFCLFSENTGADLLLGEIQNQWILIHILKTFLQSLFLCLYVGHFTRNFDKNVFDYHILRIWRDTSVFEHIYRTSLLLSGDSSL